MRVNDVPELISSSTQHFLSNSVNYEERIASIIDSRPQTNSPLTDEVSSTSGTVNREQINKPTRKSNSGRKPSTDDPKSKRIAQNRASQRAFRERKDSEKRALEEENIRLKLQVQNLESENTLFKNSGISLPYNQISIPDTFSSMISTSDACYALDSDQAKLPVYTDNRVLNTTLLDSFGTTYRSISSEIISDEPKNDIMDELFGIPNSSEPIESHKSIYEEIQKVDINELCELFRMKAICEKVKCVRDEIEDAWKLGDKDKVYNLVGIMQKFKAENGL